MTRAIVQGGFPRFRLRVGDRATLWASYLLPPSVGSAYFKYRILRGREGALLRERAPGLRMPRVTVVDFVAERRRRTDRRVHLLGPTLETATADTLRAGGQVLMLLNRRGYANYIACPDHRCGWLMCCDDCDATMVYHLDRRLPTGGYLQCHHCEAQQRLPQTCPACDRKVTTFGLGTQRVEEELHRKFPQLVEGETMVRVDSDSMRGARDFHSVLGRFATGEIRLLLGTQMIAKGLDFPGIHLVGVINADTAIHLPDFRATERTFQLVSQVTGRCGRGDTAGRVIVQTFQPDAPVIRLAADHDYEGFATGELAERRRCELPPYTRMARIVVRDTDYGRCREAARRLERLAADLRSGNAALSLDVLVQAGQAWVLAGEATRAYAVQSAALDIDPDNVELLLDRGITLATAKNYWEAVDDFNRALELAPERPDLLTLRASAYRYLDALDLARDDIARALTHAPNDPDALLERGMLRRLAGDSAGARDDWLRVIGLAEGTPSAEAARANLAKLDVKVK